MNIPGLDYRFWDAITHMTLIVVCVRILVGAAVVIAVVVGGGYLVQGVQHVLASRGGDE